MKTHDFYFDLPQELIAQTPLERRDGSRLLVLDKSTGAVEHRHFYDLPEYLHPGDCLILNNSRVLPARLLGHRLPGGGAKSCAYGCLGLGDCAAVCPFDAMHVVDGVARVDYDKCKGCGMCAQKCPKHIILFPLKDDPNPPKPVVKQAPKPAAPAAQAPKAEVPASQAPAAKPAQAAAQPEAKAEAKPETKAE